MTVRAAIVELDSELRMLREALLQAEARRAPDIERTHVRHRASARNLVHYLALRRHDIRVLQTRLSAQGLSSLGRCEPHVLAAVDAVIGRAGAGPAPMPRDDVPRLVDGRSQLDENASLLLGPEREARSTRIMVTMPSEAAGAPALVARMVESGMDVARVNCAHDDHGTWASMVRHVRAVGEGHVRVAMDLAGPKLRTGAIEPGPRVRKVAPVRDARGRVVQPALVELRHADAAAGARASRPGATTIPVNDAAWLARRTGDEEISVVDGRGARRVWRMVEVFEGGCLVSVEQTTYVETGALLSVAAAVDDTVAVGELPEIEQAHRVHRGHHVVLTRSLDPWPAVPGASVHRIGCTLAEAFDGARPGERVFLDDGKLGGVVVRADPDEFEVRITEVRPGGAGLKAGKGINLPDTDLRIAALTDKDLADLPFVVAHADIVNLSFVRATSDVEQLLDELDRLGGAHLGVVLKIENAAAFENLPELLLAAMRHEVIGVMIARGDLAVEVGFERLAEVQEEILWLCEAAHVPVIWATQVLDTMARTGRASRAEVTDAAMSERAECVMLNKGPYIVEAIGTLDSILRRMREHQDKKRSLLRKLRSWDRSTAEQTAEPTAG